MKGELAGGVGEGGGVELGVEGGQPDPDVSVKEKCTEVHVLKWHELGVLMLFTPSPISSLRVSPLPHRKYPTPSFSPTLSHLLSRGTF